MENDQNFNRQLQTLSFLSGSYESVDSFTSEYERVLGEAKAITDKDLRQARAGALKGVLLKQSQFLMNLWIQEYRDIRPDGVIVQ